MKIKSILFFLFIFVLSLSAQETENNFKVQSPDGNVALKVFLKNNKIYYEMDWFGEKMIKTSTLDYFEKRNVIVKKHKISNVDQNWKTVWGQQKNVRDNYQELELSISSNYIESKFFARVYNDGIAFRFILDKGKNRIKFYGNLPIPLKIAVNTIYPMEKANH